MENLRLAVAVQEQALTDYPTLMRPLLLRNSRYNQHATTGSLLVEVGTAGNAPEEAELAARLFFQCLAHDVHAEQEQSKTARLRQSWQKRWRNEANRKLPGCAGQFLRKSKGRVQHFFHILLII